MISIGFTGTQRGMTERQKEALYEILVWSDVLHHGDDQGADKDSHEIALRVGSDIIVHPPADTKHAAGLVGTERREPKPYLERNRDIVNESVMLIAAPRKLEEELRSGTWATIRYARKLDRPVVLLDP